MRWQKAGKPGFQGVEPTAPGILYSCPKSNCFDLGVPVSSGFLDKISALVGISDKRILVGGGVALLMLVGGGAWYLTQGTKDADEEAVAAAEFDPNTCVPETKVTVTDEDFIIGDKNAPVTLVEYLSQTCSHCAEFRATEIPKLEETFVKTGKVRIVFRELHRNNIDIAASVLGRCLGRDGFLPFTDMLLANQTTWMMREDNDVVAGLREMARRAGMSSEDFETCLKQQDVATKLAKASQNDVRKYCMTGTPTLLLNGRKIEGDNIAYAKLDEAIRAELKKAGIEAPPAATEAEGAAPVEGEAKPAEGTSVPAADGAAGGSTPPGP